jgi:hydrogenase expression/formation protein HypC
MCLAVPSKVISINDMMATIEAYGARKDVSLLLMPETVEVNDYVLVHAGFAIQKVDKAAAEDALVLIKQIVDELEKEGDAC